MATKRAVYLCERNLMINFAIESGRKKVSFMKILVTGAAGFIGASVADKLLDEGNDVIGVDNINDYYDPKLKKSRLQLLGIDADKINWLEPEKSKTKKGFTFIRLNLDDKEAVEKLFQDYDFEIVVHLAAQPGVRYSISHPAAYIESNITAFLNILEGCRLHHIRHLVFASSSSVYGLNGKVPFSEKDGISHPVSLYAATKKSNELMAHVYSHLYGLPVTGLRFFTVYGPWGRPDMSPFLFIDGIMKGKPIKVFNNGDMLRDFTFIDDIVEGVVRITKIIPEPDLAWNPEEADPSSSSTPYRIYNIGNQNPTRLLDYISAIEKAIGKEAVKEMHPMQPGDVYQTYADSSALAAATGFTPSTPLQTGIEKTVNWYKDYYGITCDNLSE